MVSAETPVALAPHPHWLFCGGPSRRPQGRRRARFSGFGLGFPSSGRPAVRTAGKGGPGGSRHPGTHGPGQVAAQTARESRTRSQRAPRTLVDGRNEKLGGGPDTSPKGLGLTPAPPRAAVLPRPLHRVTRLLGCRAAPGQEGQRQHPLPEEESSGGAKPSPSWGAPSEPERAGFPPPLFGGWEGYTCPKPSTIHPGTVLKEDRVGRSPPRPSPRSLPAAEPGLHTDGCRGHTQAALTSCLAPQHSWGKVSGTTAGPAGIRQGTSKREDPGHSVRSKAALGTAGRRAGASGAAGTFLAP